VGSGFRVLGSGFKGSGVQRFRSSEVPRFWVQRFRDSGFRERSYETSGNEECRMTIDPPEAEWNRFARSFFKIDRSTQKLTTGRIHYSMFDVGRSMTISFLFNLTCHSRPAATLV
jgi:hypothetical protein